jgi:hypothetical protein
MPVSFAKNIRPLITDTDIKHMGFFCNLGSYDDVKANAADILSRLNGSGGPQMPPKSTGGPWPAPHVALFQTWMNEGCQP